MFVLLPLLCDLWNHFWNSLGHIAKYIHYKLIIANKEDDAVKFELIEPKYEADGRYVTNDKHREKDNQLLQHSFEEIKLREG